MRSLAQREQFTAVRSVLLGTWDPIGVSDVPAAQDEYDDYIWPIIRMLSDGATGAEIARHLQNIETSRMGLSGNELRCEAAARQLIRFR